MPDIGRDIKRFFDAYHTLYVSKFGRKPDIQGGRDAGQLKRMFQRYPGWSNELFRKLLVAYLNDNSEFNMKNDYSLALFVRQIPYYHEQYKRLRIGSHDKS